MTQKQMKAEYKRMKDIVNKRLNRLRKTYPRAEWAKKPNFAGLGKNPKAKDVYKALADVASAYYNPLASIKGRQASIKHNIEEMHDHGFDFVNVQNYDDWVEFMEEVRARGLIEAFYSEEHGVDIFQTANKGGVDPKELLKDFEYYMENFNRLEDILENKEVEGMSSEEIKQYMQSRKKKHNKRT